MKGEAVNKSVRLIIAFFRGLFASTMVRLIILMGMILLFKGMLYDHHSDTMARELELLTADLRLSNVPPRQIDAMTTALGRIAGNLRSEMSVIISLTGVLFIAAFAQLESISKSLKAKNQDRPSVMRANTTESSRNATVSGTSSEDPCG